MASIPKSIKGLNDNLKITRQTFPDGERGNLATVDFMIKLAREKASHPIVRQLGINILNDARTKSHNHADEAKAIGRWVQQNVSYMKDPDGVELLQDPLYLIDKVKTGEARGDCDDMALLMATLLISVGIKPYFKVVRWKKEKGNFNHIYVTVREGNYKELFDWICLDAIIKDQEMGFELPSVSSRVIPI
jgi:hypothetical protein